MQKNIKVYQEEDGVVMQVGDDQVLRFTGYTVELVPPKDEHGRPRVPFGFTTDLRAVNGG